MDISKNNNLTPVICKVQYQFLENVSSIDEGSSIYERTVSFKTGQDWFDIYNAPSDVSFEEPPANNPGGNLYNQKLNLFYPGEDVSNIESFHNFSGRNMIVRFDYDTGISKLIGSKKNPAIGSCSLTSNNSGTGSRISFTCRSMNKAFILE